jgi:glycosyltransferase involved in cell wall biosynthesis
VRVQERDRDKRHRDHLEITEEATAVAGNKACIFHIADYSPEYSGSFIDACVAVARHCRNEMNAETRFIFPPDARTRNWLGRLDSTGFRYNFKSRRFEDALALAAETESFGPVIFHTHFSRYDLIAAAAKFLRRKPSYVVWHYHNPTDVTVLQRAKDAIKLGLVARLADVRCIAVGDGVYRSLLRAGVKWERIHLIRNGIDPRRFAPDGAARRSARGCLGVSDGTTVFLLLGWDPARKGADVYVKAAAELYEDRNVTFLIIGRRETRDFLEKMPECAKLGSRLRIVEPTEEFAPLLNAADVLVSASRVEGSPYAVGEAMAAGKIVLSSGLREMKEIFGGSPGIRFFRLDDWLALAELMRATAHLSDVERQRLGDANRQYVLENYSLEAWAAKVAGVYAALLNGR